MYTLSSSSSLTAVLDAATTTTAPIITVTYSDVLLASGAVTSRLPAATATVTMTGTTPVAVVSAPASGYAREIENIAVYNRDTVSHTVTFAGAVVLSFAIPAGQTLFFDGHTWRLGVEDTVYLAGDVTGPSNANSLAAIVPITHGGTGATTPAGALTALGAEAAISLPAGRLGTTTAPTRLVELDATGSCYFISMTLATPPTSPVEGDTYLVGTSATGAWSGYDGKIAYYVGGAWRFYAPFAGLVAYNVADGKRYFYTGSAWRTGAGPTTLAGYGITDGASLTGTQTLSHKTLASPHINATADSYSGLTFGTGLFLGVDTDNSLASIFHQGGVGVLEVGAQDHITFTTGAVAGSATERMRLTSSGLTVNGNYAPATDNTYTLGTAALRPAYFFLAPNTPASSSASGSPGQIAADANYVYVCTAANTWKRTALTTW